MSDVQKNVFYINRAGRQMVGIEPDASLSRKIPAFHPEWANEIIRHEGIPVAMIEGSWQGDNALLHRDGREIPVSQVIIAHKNENGVQFLSTVMRDMSER